MTALVDRSASRRTSAGACFIATTRSSTSASESATRSLPDPERASAGHRRDPPARRPGAAGADHARRTSRSSLTGAQLTRIVDARLGEEGDARDETEAMAERIRAADESRLVFLVGADQDRIGLRSAACRSSGRGCARRRPGRTGSRPAARDRASAALAQRAAVRRCECYVRKQWLREPLQNLCRSLDVDAGDPLLAPMKAGRGRHRSAGRRSREASARATPGDRRACAGGARRRLSGLSLQLGDATKTRSATLTREACRPPGWPPTVAARTLGAVWRPLVPEVSVGEPDARRSAARGCGGGLPMLYELPARDLRRARPAYAGGCIALITRRCALSSAAGAWSVCSRAAVDRVGREKLGEHRLEWRRLGITGLAAGVELHKSRWDATLAGAIVPSPTLAVDRASTRSPASCTPMGSRAP